MFNWIKKIAIYDFSLDEIDHEDFQLGFECVLPAEIQELLTGQNKSGRRINSKNAGEKEKLILDEHELALG
ncbi:MAG: hypothetical protein PHR94_10180 [Methylomonas lenta]|nr:hypothetical protein [Methylomonas lenta]